MTPGLLRQIKDVQVQAQRLITSKCSLEEIKDFGNYSNQMKIFLLENISEETIRSYTLQIPDLETELESEENLSGALLDFFSYVSAGITSYYIQKKKVEIGVDVIREIQGKYASIEFLLKNLD